jgi:hypothetical protein
MSVYGGPPLQKPMRVFVVDFASSPSQVSLNGGSPAAPGAAASPGLPQNLDQLKLGQEAAAVLSEELAKQITVLGFPSERAPAGKRAEPGTMVVEGQFVSVDEGNRFTRLVIGFGAGATHLKTLAQVYVGTPGGPVLAQTFETESKSAPTPGLVAGGPALAAGRVVVAGAVAATKVVSQSRTGIAAEAEHTAEELGKRLAEFFAAQGWIPLEAAR